jgi:DNA-nicking Smr family endonuclease
METMSKKCTTVIERSFSRLSNLIDDAGLRLKTKPSAASASAPKPASQTPSAGSLVSSSTDESVFLNAMNDISRVSWRHDPHPSPDPPPICIIDSDLEDRRLMQTAIDEDAPMPVADHPEYIEGWIGIAGRKFLPQLRNERYSIQGQLDLHGFNRIEAQIAVEDYIIAMSRLQSCCIKIIHGRGMNSPTNRAILKEDLQRLLKTRRMARYVVAYASAPSCDGGVGAVYILLRRQG